MKFWRLPASNLVRRPTRSALTMAGIAVAVGSFLALVGLSRGLEQAWTDSMHQRGGDIIAVRKGSINILAATLDEETTNRMLHIDGVASVAGELMDMVELETGETLIVSGWADDGFLWQKQRLSQGTWPSLSVADGVVLGQTIADLLRKRVGDVIEFGDRKLAVTGIIAAEDMESARFIVVRLRLLQQLTGKRGKVTVFHICLGPSQDDSQALAVQNRLARSFPDLRFSRSDAAAKDDTVFLLLRTLAWGISTVGLATALVLVLNTQLMSVLERKTEIGVLAALGWQNGRILAVIVLEGVLLGVLGGLLGSCLGAIGLHWLTRMPQIHVLVSARITWRALAEICAATLLMSIIGSAYPAWRAARLNVVDALRDE